jgi:hypothetical protein
MIKTDTIKPLNQGEFAELEDMLQFHQKLVRKVFVSLLAISVIATLLPHKAFPVTLTGYGVKFILVFFPGLLLLLFALGHHFQEIKRLQKDIAHASKRVFRASIQAKKPAKKGQGGLLQLSNQQRIEVLKEEYEKYNLDQVLYVEQACESGHIFRIEKG